MSQLDSPLIIIKPLTIFLSNNLESFIEELKTYREIITLNDQMKVNMEMYPEGVREGRISSVRRPIDEQLDEKGAPSEFKGMQGSFRKLEID